MSVHVTTTGAILSTHHPSTSRPAGWVVGMSVFAAIIMLMIGIFHAVQGLVALVRSTRSTSSVPATYSLSTSPVWRIHLGLEYRICSCGILLIAAGFGIRRRAAVSLVGRNRLCRADSMIANFLFIPYYPVWWYLVLVVALQPSSSIWALCVYNEDAAHA